MFGLNLTIMGNFHRHEVVGRGSEKQIQVGKNLNIFLRDEGRIHHTTNFVRQIS